MTETGKEIEDRIERNAPGMMQFCLRAGATFDFLIDEMMKNNRGELSKENAVMAIVSAMLSTSIWKLMTELGWDEEKIQATVDHHIRNAAEIKTMRERLQ